MNNHAPVDLTEQVSAAFDWWREAGVDCEFHDAPTDWLASSQPPSADRPAFRERPGGQPLQESADGEAAGQDQSGVSLQALPTTLEAFAEWWLAEPTLDDGRQSGRIAPRGMPGAEVMILVPEPEAEDRDTLLSGAQGRLMDAVLLAMGVAADQAYLASALPRHTPMADWAGLQARGFPAVVSRHVALARPKRLLVFGTNILPLLGHDPAQPTAVLREFNHEGVTVPLFAARGLAALLERPRWKAAFWRGWLDWTSGDQSPR